MKQKKDTSRRPPDLQKNNIHFLKFGIVFKNLTQLPRVNKWSHVELYTPKLENIHIFF